MFPRSHVRFACWAVGALLLAGPTASSAQGGRTRARPRLEAGADTNSALAYFWLGRAELVRDPQRAADAFYWATRLEPALAEAWYGRYVASLLADPNLLVAFWRNNERELARPRARAIDSLRLRAVLLDPLCNRGLDGILIERAAEEFLVQRYNLHDRRAEVEYLLRRELAGSLDPRVRGWIALAHGQWPDALRNYDELVRRDTTLIGVRLDRAYAFAQLGSLDSARAELERAIRLLHGADTARMALAYRSKEHLEFMLGRMAERQSDTAAARAAYERALVENLGFYPARGRLALINLLAGDTSGAVRELEAAVHAYEHDYHSQLMLAFLLNRQGRLEDAAGAAARAIAVEPWVAAPHVVLAQIHEQAGRRAEAVRAYEGYLARASRTDPVRDAVTRRIEALRAEGR